MRVMLTRALAVLALLVAAGLVVFALDVLRWSRQLHEQDTSFVAVPRHARFTEPSSLIPFGLAERALSAGDDLFFRRQLQAFARVRPGAVADARQFELRGETQLALARLSRTDPDAGRRSRASNMLGVLALDPRLVPTIQEEYAKLTDGAIDAFRDAVEIDPGNADAKRNLELALRLPAPAVAPGSDPTGSPDAGKIAGSGEPGSGY